MASPVNGDDITLLSDVANVCDRMAELLRLLNTTKSFLDWFIDPATNEISDDAISGLLDRLSPIGMIIFWGSEIPPGPNWMMCLGQAISRTTYAALFARISTTFGVGDGGTTFNLPDASGKFLVGAGGGGGYTLADTGGENTHVLTESEMPAHTHPLPGGVVDFVGTGGGGGTSALNDLGHVTNSTGGGAAHENRPPYLAGYWMIKVL